jgi:hypothetical protein
LEKVRAQPLPFHPLKWVALFTGPPIAVENAGKIMLPVDRWLNVIVLVWIRLLLVGTADEGVVLWVIYGLHVVFNATRWYIIKLRIEGIAGGANPLLRMLTYPDLYAHIFSYTRYNHLSR